jgi:hypothetical protein
MNFAPKQERTQGAKRITARQDADSQISSILGYNLLSILLSTTSNILAGYGNSAN